MTSVEQRDVRRPVRTRRRAALLAALLLVLGAGSAAAQAPGVKAKPPRLGWPTPVPLGAPLELRAPTSQAINEVEPNNSPATAQQIPFPEQVLGAVSPAGDVDWYALNLAAGASLDIEVFSERINSTMDSYIELVGPDGVTTVAFNDDGDSGLDSRIRAVIPTAGRYYLAIVDLFGRGGPTYQYRLEFRVAATGPGDPTTLYRSGLGSAWQTAAAPGALYMVSQEGHIKRIPATGEPTVFLTDVGVPYDVVIDGYGALLIAGFTNQLNGVVTRVDLATGARTTLIGSGLQSAASITVGPDGDVWVADVRATRIHRFDPSGALKSSLSTANTHGQTVLDLAFSPSGVLYYSNMIDAIYRVVDGAPQRVIQGSGLGGIAFDSQGNLYVGTVSRGVLKYSPAHALVEDPYALGGLSLTGALVFLRDAAGAMTSRLIAVNLGEGTMRELNPAGMVAPGHRIGANLLTITTTTLRQAQMGFAYADTLRVAETETGLVWTLSAGTLPRGVTLSPGGVLAGVPEETGTFAFTARVQGATRTGIRVLSMNVVHPTVQVTAAINHLLGVPGQLSTDMARYLDLQGNRNGRYDIGDLKAFRRFLEAGGTVREDR
jgi:hypothetical protein